MIYAPPKSKNRFTDTPQSFVGPLRKSSFGEHKSPNSRKSKDGLSRVLLATIVRPLYRGIRWWSHDGSQDDRRLRRVQPHALAHEAARAQPEGGIAIALLSPNRDIARSVRCAAAHGARDAEFVARAARAARAAGLSEAATLATIVA